ncbi:hypothetical protein M405DRAFT_870412 [Rhizopogon salebrosus TDB-379]|nr:hypothetical protein M405DRAFT_870412 [Rhizopogon salebrosus TDB-379]
MSDLSDVFDMKCFTERVINGTYDQVADAVDHLGKDALANADFGTDWGTAVEDHTSGTNWSYVDKKTGRPFRTNIIGQIACSQFGTKHSAKGTHFSKKVMYPMLPPHPDNNLANTDKKNKPLEDNDSVKWKWALVKPTQCSFKLTDIWEDQLTSIADWTREESKKTVTDSRINQCVAKTAPDLQYEDIIILTSQRIYEARP